MPFHGLLYIGNFLARKHLAVQAFAVTGQTQAKSDEFRALRSLFMIA
jgi:hypothetical protein